MMRPAKFHHPLWLPTWGLVGDSVEGDGSEEARSPLWHKDRQVALMIACTLTAFFLSPPNARSFC